MKFFRSKSFRAAAAWGASCVFCLSILIWASVSVETGTAHHAASGMPQKVCVIIDPGHGGADGGASAADGTPEKELNLKLSMILRTFFETFGYDTVMTRTDDSDTDGADGFDKRTDILNRLKLAEENPEAVFISVHVNLSTSARDKGFQVFYGTLNPDSKTYAEAVRARVSDAEICTRIRDAVPAPQTVYIQQHAENPCILVECGFLSNDEDYALLNDQLYCEKLMFSVFAAVTEVLQ